MARGRALAGHRAPVRRRRRAAPARLGPRRAHARAAAARSGSGSCSRDEEHVARARRAHRRPGRADGARPGSRRSTSPAGRSPPTRTSRARRTPTRASTRRTARPRSSAGSTTRCCAPTRSRAPRATPRRDWLAADRRRRGGRLRRPAERVRADEGDDRGGRGGRALRGPARLGEEVRPPRRQGARPDAASSSARSTRRGSRPTCSTCRRCSSRAPTRSSATLLTSDVDERDRAFSPASARPRASSASATGSRRAIARGARVRAVRRPALVRDLDARPRRGARRSPSAIHERFPGKLLAYNCSPSFNWQQAPLRRARSRAFQTRARAHGLPLPVRHARRLPRAQLVDVRARARLRVDEGMTAYVRLQEREFELEDDGYTATRHQREVGAGYFDRVLAGGHGRRELDARARRLHRGGSSSDAAEQAALTRRRSTAERRSSPREALELRRRAAARVRARAGASCSRARRAPAAARAGELPDFLPRRRPSAQATGASRRPGRDLRDRRVEITGPVDRKMMINALNSGAQVFMADFEDAHSPTWENVVEGQRNLTRRASTARSRSRRAREAVPAERRARRRSSSGRAAGTSSSATSLVDGEPVSASLFDFGLFLFHNAREQLERGSGPVLLPAEAREPPRGAALERRVRARAGRARRARAARSARRS